MQLLATAFVCYLAMRLQGQYVGGFSTLSFGSFIASSTGFYIFVFVFTFLLLIPLICFKNMYPINYILLSFWTITISFSVASACVVTLCDPMVQQGSVLVPLSYANATGDRIQLYNNALYCALGTEQERSGTNSVLMALGITAGLFIGLTIFTFQSRWDFSFLGAGLGAALWILILWGFCMAIFGGGGMMRYLYRQTLATPKVTTNLSPH